MSLLPVVRFLLILLSMRTSDLEQFAASDRFGLAQDEDRRAVTVAALGAKLMASVRSPPRYWRTAKSRNQ